MNQGSIDIPNRKAINLQLVEIPQGQITLRNDRIKHIWTANIHPFQRQVVWPQTEDKAILHRLKLMI